MLSRYNAPVLPMWILQWNLHTMPSTMANGARWMLVTEAPCSSSESKITADFLAKNILQFNNFKTFCSLIFIPLFQQRLHRLAFSGQGQKYSWLSTWWLLSPSCWSWRMKKSIFKFVIKTSKNPLETGKKLPQKELFVEINWFCKRFKTKVSKLFF